LVPKILAHLIFSQILAHLTFPQILEKKDTVPARTVPLTTVQE
jgi:hypothetical protein